jgi:hypothetical protein
VGGHIVGSFGGMAIAYIFLGDMSEEIAQILPYVGIGIFLDQQRGGGVADKAAEKPAFDS